MFGLNKPVLTPMQRGQKAGILFRELLDQIQIAGFPLGFWFAQQGSIYVFVLLIFVYVYWMNQLDKKYGYDEGE